jgi:hypothetical protein
MSRGTKLIGPWRRIHGAVWLIGLAILFSTGRWWPGILVLIAISAILEAVIQLAVPEAVAPELESEEEASVPPPPVAVATASEPQHRADLLPSKCPGCGAPVREDKVQWTGPQSADCPYCGTNLPMRQV